MRAIALSLLFGFLAPALAAAQSLLDSTPHIAVTGVASEEVAPDRATVYFGVIAEKPTAAEASAEAARVAQALIEEIKAQGVDAKDVRTRDMSLAPYSVEERDAKGVVKRTQKGFRARNDFSVRIKPIDKASVLVGQLAEKGANSFQGIVFDVSDSDAKLDALRAAAVKDAQRRAEAYLGAAGLRLGRVLQIRPEADDGGGPLPAPYAARMAAPEAAGAPVPIEPGVQKLAARVTVVWALAR